MDNEQAMLPGLSRALDQGGAAQAAGESESNAGGQGGEPRFKPVDRRQLQLRVVHTERLIAEDHAARAIWEFVGQLDLSGYAEKVRAVEGVAGRPAWNPQLLISLWVWAYSQGVSSAREIARLCGYDPAYQWLTGLEQVNAHTLSDFRVAHDEELHELFVQVLGVLSGDGLISLQRVMQDGTKIQAQAASDSFRTEKRVTEQVRAAREHVEAVDKMAEEESSQRMAKARERARREREERLAAALAEFEKLRGEKSSQERVSTTDPEARVMKQADGGFAPSYNVQLSTDAAHGLVVGVEVTQAGNDFGQLTPGVDRVEENLGQRPQQMVADGGYVSRDNIVEMAQRGVEFIGPQCDEQGKGQSAYQRRAVSPEYHSELFVYDAASDSFQCPQGKILSYEGRHESKLQISYKYRAKLSDCQVCPAKGQCCPKNETTGRSVQRTEELEPVVDFRHKMQTEAAREIYRQRSQVAETPNLWIKAKFGLRQFRVRGLRKVGMEALWACLTYNIQQWIRLRWRIGASVATATL